MRVTAVVWSADFTLPFALWSQQQKYYGSADNFPRSNWSVVCFFGIRMNAGNESAVSGKSLKTIWNTNKPFSSHKKNVKNWWRQFPAGGAFISREPRSQVPPFLHPWMPPDSSDLQTWPYHLNLLVPKAEVISSSPSLDRRSAVGVLSIIRTLHILQIIALSVRCSPCRSDTVGAHVSLPWSRAERT